MALTLAEKDAQTVEPTLISRVRQAVSEHAKYMLDLPGNQAQLDWAARMFWNGGHIAQAAVDMMRELVCDGAIANSSLDGGGVSDVTDTALKGAVDAICEKYSG